MLVVLCILCLTVFETVFLFRRNSFFTERSRITCDRPKKEESAANTRATACVLGVAGVHVSGLNPLRNPRESRNVTLASLFVLNQPWTSRAFSRPSALIQPTNHIVLKYQHPHLIHISSTVTRALYLIKIRRLRFVDFQDPVTGMTFPHSSTALSVATPPNSSYQCRPIFNPPGFLAVFTPTSLKTRSLCSGK